jgi:hypothetical protein
MNSPRTAATGLAILMTLAMLIGIDALATMNTGGAEMARAASAPLAAAAETTPRTPRI